MNKKEFIDKLFKKLEEHTYAVIACLGDYDEQRMTEDIEKLITQSLYLFIDVNKIVEIAYNNVVCEKVYENALRSGINKLDFEKDLTNYLKGLK